MSSATIVPATAVHTVVSAVVATVVPEGYVTTVTDVTARAAVAAVIG